MNLRKGPRRKAKHRVVNHRVKRLPVKAKGPEKPLNRPESQETKFLTWQNRPVLMTFRRLMIALAGLSG
jgi:hypothetical protein